jgi:hypothetical protein
MPSTRRKPRLGMALGDLAQRALTFLWIAPTKSPT